MRALGALAFAATLSLPIVARAQTADTPSPPPPADAPQQPPPADDQRIVDPERGVIIEHGKVFADPEHPVSSPAMKRFMAPATILDLNVEGGYGHTFANPHNGGFLRGRAGLMLVRDPFFEALGITYEYSRFAKATLGIQAEIDWQRGLWAQAGVFKDADTKYAGGMLAFGLAIFGVEAQLRSSAETHGNLGFAIYGKVRIPLGIIFHAISTF